MRRPSCAGVDLVVLVMTSLTFDTTEVFILSANSAVTLATGSVRAPVSPALTACCSTVFFVLALGAFGAGVFSAGVCAACAVCAFTAGRAAAAASDFAAAFGAAAFESAAFAGAALTATAFFTAGAGGALATGVTAGLALAAGTAADPFLAAGRAAGAPALFLVSAEATALTEPVLPAAPATAGLPDFFADFVTVSFILPSRCLPLAAMACWQFSR